ncbi:MAG TPA: hypothetical protein VLT33_16290 [Labilithrix sp.]|nr:hypothetical protein [Labilithrix sp.]
MTDLPPLTSHLLDLFQGPLRDVRFPDADGERLGAAVEAATAAGDAVARAEAAVEAARSVLADKQRIVAQETDRALAYARVYAADRPDLRAAIDAVTARPTTAKRGPGRPRKVTAAPAIDAEASAAE